MKNLVILAAGDESLHSNWLYPNRDFDLFIVYYGKTPNKYFDESTFYATGEGPKFHLVHKVIQEHLELLAEYDAIFIPDDDLCLPQWEVNRFFRLFHFYELQLAQPSIIGWLSHPMCAPNAMNLLRYTNWVEIMCPCFSKNAFKVCSSSFLETKSNWGIEWLWPKLLGYPEDKIAIVDAVTATHTRPCFFGDTYWRNGNTFETCSSELKAFCEKHNLTQQYVEYGKEPIDMQSFYDLPSEDKLYPDLEKMKEFASGLRRQRMFL